jgi:omega-6 fatty acid desaturase (delta-12 desaturase)
LAFWRNQRLCKFVEETVKGSGVFFFRNLHGKGVPAKDLTGGKQEVFKPKKFTAAELRSTKGVVPQPRVRRESISEAVVSSVSMGVSNAKRRLSMSVEQTAKALPVLTETVL